MHWNISSPGLGEARVEQLLRAVERGSHRVRLRLRAVRRAGLLDTHRALRRHHALRAAHGLADAGGRGPGALTVRAARGGRRGRAAQPRGHRAGARGLGPHHPRRLRPDRDHRADRQLRPASRSRPGSMGRPLPGYRVALLDADGQEADEGEIALALDRRPLGLMAGYLDDDPAPAEAMRGGCYHTGDVARRDADGYITYVGRADDVFKSSDYRISPFELESALSSTRLWRRRRSCPARTRCGSACRRRCRARAAASPVAGDGAGASSGSSADGSRRTSASGASSSPTCPRRSPERSGGWSCGPSSSSGLPTGRGENGNGGRRSFPNCGRSLRSFLPTRMCGPNHREGATPARVLGHLCPDVPHVRWVRRVWIDAESAIAAPAQSAGARSGAIKLAHRTPGPLHRTPSRRDQRRTPDPGLTRHSGRPSTPSVGQLAPAPRVTRVALRRPCPPHGR